MKRIAVKAETDLERTDRHMREERKTLEAVHGAIKDLVGGLELLSETTYNTMELNSLYEECLDVLQAWPNNLAELRKKGLESAYK